MNTTVQYASPVVPSARGFLPSLTAVVVLSGFSLADDRVPGRVLDTPTQLQQFKVDQALSILASNGFASGSCVQTGVTIMNDESGDGKPGYGDSDAIALDIDSHSASDLAVIINHEYAHVIHRNGAQVDPTTDHHTVSGYCAHVAMAQDDLNSACYLSYEGYTISCAMMAALLSAINSGILSCINQGGSYPYENPSGNTCNCCNQ